MGKYNLYLYGLMHFVVAALISSALFNFFYYKALDKGISGIEIYISALSMLISVIISLFFIKRFTKSISVPHFICAATFIPVLDILLNYVIGLTPKIYMIESFVLLILFTASTYIGLKYLFR